MDAAEAVGMGVIFAPDGGDAVRADPTSHAAATWLAGNVSKVRRHPALIGYYICDDCCTTLPSVHNLTAVFAVIKAEDPFHVTMGAADCSDSYQFTDAAGQLSLDVPMIENYLGNPKDGTGTGTWPGGPARDGSLRHFPQGRIPIVNMPGSARTAETQYGPCTSSLQAEVTLAWDAVVTAQLYSACWFDWDPGKIERYSAGDPSTVFASQLAELNPSLAAQLPVTVGAVQEMTPDGAGLQPIPNPIARATGWGEMLSMAGGGHNMVGCVHLVAINPYPRPVTLQVKVGNLGPLGFDPAAPINATRIFTGGYNLTAAWDVDRGGEARLVFRDWVDGLSTNVYRVGCGHFGTGADTGRDDRDSPNLAANADFEDVPTAGTANLWTLPYMDFGQDVLRTSISADTRLPYQGRHSGRIVMPSADAPAIVAVPMKPVRNFATACNGTRVITAADINSSTTQATTAGGRWEEGKTRVVNCTETTDSPHGRPRLEFSGDCVCAFGNAIVLNASVDNALEVSLMARASPPGANLTLSIITGVAEWVSGYRRSDAQFRFLEESVVATRAFGLSDAPLAPTTATVRWWPVGGVTKPGCRGGLFLKVTGAAPGSVYVDSVSVLPARGIRNAL